MYSVLDDNERIRLCNEMRSSFPIIQAVIEGVQQGQIFKSNNNDCWVLHKAGFSEVFLAKDDGNDLVNFMLVNQAIPKYFHIYNPPDALTSVIKSRADVFNTRERDRIQLSYIDIHAEHRVRAITSDEFEVADVTAENFDSLSAFNLDLASKFWNSKEDFINNALGVFIKDDQNNPLSLCYAAAVAGQKAEVDVVTSEQYRGMGLAKVVVSDFINKCANKSIYPNWDCFLDNQASLKVALKHGFRRISDYKFLSVYIK